MIITKIKSKDFANKLPKNELWLLSGINEHKNCYFAWYNGKLLGIIYNLDKFKKVFNN